MTTANNEITELAQIADEQPAPVQHAFETWWNNPNQSSGAMNPDDELVCFVAFAAGFKEAARLSVIQNVGR